MSDAVIVATARTAIGKAGRGALNNLDGPELGAIIEAALQRAGLEPGEVDDVLLGAARLEGPQRGNGGGMGAAALFEIP